jgi:hypothetical protein
MAEHNHRKAQNGGELSLSGLENCVPQKGGGGGLRSDRASIEGNRRAARCTPYSLFMCIYCTP